MAELTTEQKRAVAKARARMRLAQEQKAVSAVTDYVPKTRDGRTVAPGTDAAMAADIPEGMVFDPQTGGYFDAALAAERSNRATGGVEGFTGNVVAGMPFVGEYADEGLGAAYGAITGRSPELGQEYARQTAMQYAEKNPGKALAGRVGGGVLGSLGALKAIGTAAPGFARWVGSFFPSSTTGQIAAGIPASAAIGGLEGAVSGYGAGRGDNRVGTAAEYGGYGVLGGAVAGMVAPLANKGAQAVMETLKDNWSRVSKRIPGLSPEASAELREAAQADMLAGGINRNINRAGSAAMVADAGQASSDLLDTAASMSQRGGAVALDRINQRASGAMRTLNESFDQTMGSAQGVRTLNNAIEEATRPGIKTAYQQAYTTPIDYTTGGKGDAVLGVLGKIPDRIKQPALRLAREMMELDEIPPQLMISIDGTGNASISRMPGVAEVDYVKRALDSIAEDSRNQLGKLSSEGRLAAEYARRLRTSVRDAVPVYGEALDQASDAFGLQRAIEMGDKMLSTKTKVDEFQAWVKEASPVERQAAISGLRANISETLDNVKRTLGNPDVDVQQVKAAIRNLSSPAARKKMIALLGRGEARKVFRSLDQAGTAIELQGDVARNSRTAPRVARDARIRDRQDFSTGQIARDAASGEILSAPRKLARISAGNTPMAQNARTEEMYQEIAEYLTGARGQEALRKAEQMILAAQNSPAQAAQLQRLGQRAAAAIGVPLYQSQVQSQRTGPR